jgi:hypothetical protein
LRPHKDRPGADVVTHMVGVKSADGVRAWLDKAVNPPAPLMTRLKGLFK